MSLEDQLFPFRLDRDIARKILVRLNLRARKDDVGLPLGASWGVYRQLDEDDLKESLRVELSRREIIQRRALSFLGVIAVMSAFTLGAIGLTHQNRHVVPTWLLLLPVGVALAYFTGGTWAALRTVAPEQLHDLFLQVRLDGGKRWSDDDWKDVILKAIEADQAYNLIYSIYAARSYRCLRNGLFCLVLALFLLLGDAALAG
jgi:hypothetical protein